MSPMFFGKRHDAVLRDITNLKANCPESFHIHNFVEMSQNVQIGNGATRQSPMYAMTRDGLTLLVMGYTGKQAMQFKIAYIEAFNRMEASLHEKTSAPPAPVAPVDTADEITRELCQMIRQNMDGKPLAEKINIWGRVTGALNGQTVSPTPAETSLLQQSELWQIAETRRNGTEAAVSGILKKALDLLDNAFWTSGFLTASANESVRKSLIIACRCNIDAAGAIARALMAPEGATKMIKAA